MTRRVRPGSATTKRRTHGDASYHVLRPVYERLLTDSLLCQALRSLAACIPCRSFVGIKCMGAHPLAGRALPHLTSLAPQCPPGSTSQRKRRTSSSPHVRPRKRALPHWGTAARVSSRWSFRCPCVSRFTMHRVIAMMSSSLPEDHRRFRFNLGLWPERSRPTSPSNQYSACMHPWNYRRGVTRCFDQPC